VVVVVVLCSVAVQAQPPGTNTRPIIGILTVGPADDHCETSPEQAPGRGSGGCFDAVYVKYLESAGARVAPVPYNANKSELDFLFAGLNGLLYTGGGLSLAFNTTYFQTAYYMYQKAVAANLNGDVFPLWGTCMGFQLLNVMTAYDQSVLSRYQFDSEYLLLPLDFTLAALSSRMFGTAPKSIFASLAVENISVNLHHDGVKPDVFAQNPNLVATYNILSTNVDRKGNPFISAMEGKTLPFYGVQFHPERPLFDWTPAGMIHTGSAINVGQWLAGVMAGESRRSQHQFAPEDEPSVLIYNWTPVYLGDSTLVYFIDPLPLRRSFNS